MISEEAIVFHASDAELVGIVAKPTDGFCRIGVIVVVGGPQYRVGSHRQFLLLSRSLADDGIACLRFDYSGMGDSHGEAKRFDQVEDDIRSAIDELLSRIPSINSIVLWGLCDGASAASCYDPSDRRVSGLVLLNPWVRTEQTAAATLIRHYYLRRLFDRSFWRKMLSNSLQIRKSFREVTGTIRQMIRHRRAKVKRSDEVISSMPLPRQMAMSVQSSGRKLLLILSGRDLVAKEFEDIARRDELWTRLLHQAAVERLPEADHTFSNFDMAGKVEQVTLDWLRQTFGRQLRV